jgi:glycerol dehydrogenase
MPIKEKSFRIGCGRYLQEPEILKTLGAEVRRLGNAPLIVGGKTALSLTRATIETSVSAVCRSYRIEEHLGTCNDEDAKSFAELAKKEGLDVIVGVGGGVIMDFAKLIGHFASLPVINAPTSSATCAAYTPLSVRYTPEGRTVGTMHYEREVDAVLADTAVIASQPPRLLLAGVFDALAKFVEIKQRFKEETKDYPLGLNWAYILSKQSFEELSRKTAPCLVDMKNGIISNTVEQIIFTAVAATGVISGIARGSNQCALAHKFYETTRLLYPEAAAPYLHGEIVGVGLLLQNRFNGECENNEALLSLMRENGMPCSIADVGVERTEESFNEYYTRICNSSAINKNDADECARFKESLRYLWGIV